MIGIVKDARLNAYKKATILSKIVVLLADMKPVQVNSRWK